MRARVEKVDVLGWNKSIGRKGQKENLHLKAINMIDPVTGWFGIEKYYDKRTISMVDLVETTWLYRYPRPMEITYDQGS